MFDTSRAQPIDQEESLILYESECGNLRITYIRSIVEQYEYILLSLDVARHCGCITSGCVLLPHLYHRLNMYAFKIRRHLAKKQELMNFHLMFDTTVNELFSKSTM